MGAPHSSKGLPTYNKTPESFSTSKTRTFFILLLLICSIFSFHSLIYNPFPKLRLSHQRQTPTPLADQCTQVDPLFPAANSDLDSLQDLIVSSTYRDKSIAYLSNAVKIPTVSRDVMGPPDEDERWDIFYEFEDYLEKTFPEVHKTLVLEKVNTHGLLYTWKGTDDSLKPTLLMAHTDVVPVPKETVPTWTHPPFSGFYDGTFIWGRGSSDCKNQLLAIFEAIELLIQADFVPKRTVILSFGFDEESKGYDGAGSLAPVIQERYGKDSIAVIVDEGAGISEKWGQLFATPGTGEKGSIDVTITIRMPGGHSSVPPRHTSIGVMSELITLIENDTYQTYLESTNPYLLQMQCGATHAPDFPKPLKKLLEKSQSSGMEQCGRKKDILAEEAAKESPAIQYLMTTSVAVDVIVGGEKSNALPEQSSVIVNHRVNVGDTPEHVKAKIASHAKAVAEKHNLTLHAYNADPDNLPPSSISLIAPVQLDVAPVTPTLPYLQNNTLSPYGILSGTTRALYGTETIVSPGMSTGNTDTRFYWDLTPHIFRFGPGWSKETPKNGLGGIHTVDENVSVDAHLAGVRWFVLFIRNMDEAELA